MNKKQKLEYLKKLIESSEFERKLRDADVALYKKGKKPGPLTGYPYFDRPWVDKYNPEPSFFDTSLNLYTAYETAVKDRLAENAVYVYETDTEYTHTEIIDLVNNASAGLAEMGINENSTVGIMLNGSIEEVVVFLALQKIGAKAKYIDYMKSVPAMQHNVEEDNIDLLVMDECFLPLDNIINNNHIKVMIANNKKSTEDENHVFFETVCKLGEGKSVPTVPYDENKDVVTINSSGTNGAPKPIDHSAKGILWACAKVYHTDYPLGKNDVIIKMIPSQIGLGLITSLYTGLLSNSEVVLIGGNGTDNMIENLNTFIKDYPKFCEKRERKPGKINLFTAPIFVRNLIHDDTVKDLSHMGSILAAGSKISEEELDALEEKARSKGCKIAIHNGYGQNEMAGAITLNQHNSNKNGSAGFPTYNTDVVIIDQATHELLGPNQVGLILERSESMFNQYHNMPDTTKEAFITLGDKATNDDTTWFNTFDLGYFDEDGHLFITGRTTRVVVREDFKISLDAVESKIRNMDVIGDCATIRGIDSEISEEIAVFVQPANESITEEEIIEAIKGNPELSYYEQPRDIIFTEKIPHKDHGKTDYVLLKEEYATLNNLNRFKR